MEAGTLTENRFMNKPAFILRTFGITDVGCVREHNEDAILLLTDTASLTPTDNTAQKNVDLGTVLMVADGLGGLNAGEVASRIAKGTILDRFAQLSVVPETDQKIRKYLFNLVMDAHQAILHHSQEDTSCRGMGTTMLIAWIVKGYVYICWSGDSRGYIYNPSRLTAIRPFTDDHSLVWQMVLAGEMTAEQARVDQQSHLILQSLGDTDSPPNPSFKKSKIATGDRILVCSDGLTSMLSDDEIQQILDLREETETTCHRLVEAAKKAGGKDNISVLLADVDRAVHPYSKRTQFIIAFLIILGVFLGLGWYLSKKKISGRTSFAPDSSMLAPVNRGLYVDTLSPATTAKELTATPLVSKPRRKVEKKDAHVINAFKDFSTQLTYWKDSARYISDDLKNFRQEMQQVSEQNGAAGMHDDYASYLKRLDQLDITLAQLLFTLDTLAALANQGQKQSRVDTEKLITEMKQHLVALCDQKDVHPCLEVVEGPNSIHTISANEPKLALASIQHLITNMIDNLKIELRDRKLNAQTMANNPF